MVHKYDFIRFVGKRKNKSNDNILCSSNVQFQTIIQQIYGNRSILYKLIVNHLRVSKYYHERRDMYLFIKKDTRCVYIFRDDLNWVFPEKYSLKIGANIRGFTFNITLEVNDDVRIFLEQSTDLINKETVPTKGHFFFRRKDIEEAVEKLNKIGTDFYLNESYFLDDKSGFIDQTFITE